MCQIRMIGSLMTNTKKLHRTVTEETKRKILDKMAMIAEDIINLEDSDPTFHIIRNLVRVADAIGEHVGEDNL